MNHFYLVFLALRKSVFFFLSLPTFIIKNKDESFVITLFIFYYSTNSLKKNIQKNKTELKRRQTKEAKTYGK